MLKSCKYCGRIHDEKYICPKKTVKKKDSTEIEKFRGSKLWKKKREEIRSRDYFCRLCIRDKTITKDSLRTDELSVHHIIPLNEDFDRRLDEDNLITLCSRHHEDAEAGKISRATLLKLARESVDLDIPPV